MRRLRHIGWLVLGASFATWEPARAVDNEDFAAVRVALTRQLAVKDPAQRASALRKLQDFPIAEAADMIVKKGLKDADARVRRAAYEALLAMKDEPQVCELLLAQLNRDAKRRGGADLSPAILAVVMASQTPQAKEDSLKVIDGVLSASKDGQRLLLGLADELGMQGEKDDVPALVRLSESQAFQRDFALRRAVVHALCKIPHADAIEGLVSLLSRCDGEAQADAVLYLTAVTKEAHGGNVAAWAKWWQENKATFRYPAAVARLPDRKIDAASSSSYYGLPVNARRMVFVIDTSGSMRGGKLEAAQRELNQAIGALPETSYFSVVAFNSRVFSWQKQLAPANSQNKLAATSFVTRLSPDAKTATYDALDIAFQFDAEAIYLLTDGEPDGGRVDPVEEIVSRIGKANTTRRKSIYTIGVGVGPEGGKFEWFLKTLAEQNYGTFRRVDR